MRIADVVLAAGTSGYFHKDMLAIKGGVKSDGFLLHGPVVQQGLQAIVEPASIISIMLVLEDGRSAYIGLACAPDFMLSKPGLSGDEALMIQQNEMSRTFALIAARGIGQPAAMIQHATA
jgi:methylaspartate ammonia-lyase